MLKCDDVMRVQTCDVCMCAAVMHVGDVVDCPVMCYACMLCTCVMWCSASFRVILVPLLQKNFVPSLLTLKRSEGGGKIFAERVILVPLLQENFVPSLLTPKRSEGGGKKSGRGYPKVAQGGYQTTQNRKKV